MKNDLIFKLKGSYKNFLQELLILLLFFLLTIWYFFPVFKNFDQLLPGDWDELHITWTINKLAQNIPSLPEKLMTGNIFYPHPYSLAYSDPFITSSLIAKPFLSFWPEPIFAFNINLILGQWLTLYFTYLFLKQLTNDKLIALVFSIIFCFSQIRLHFLPHLNFFSIQWLALAGYALVKLAKTKNIIFLYLWSLAFILQTLNSFLVGYFIIFLSISLIFVYPSLLIIFKKNLKHLALTIMFIALTTLPFINIYLKVSHYFNYVRSITDVIHFSLSPEEIIISYFSPILFLIFLVGLIFFVFQNYLKNTRSFSILILAITSFLLSLGPALHWMSKTVKLPFSILGFRHIALPYLIFYYLLPGFQGFRTPSRFILLFGFGAVIFSALIFTKLFTKRRFLGKMLLLSLLFLSLWLAPKKNNYITVPKIANYPLVYQWLKNQNGNIIIELPISTWGTSQQSKQEVYRMLYSLLHQKMLINGYSGFTPFGYYPLVNLLASDFLNEQTIAKLKELKVNYVIVHKKEYQQIWKNDLENKLIKLNNMAGIKKVYEFDSDMVWEL